MTENERRMREQIDRLMGIVGKGLKIDMSKVPTATDPNNHFSTCWLIVEMVNDKLEDFNMRLKKNATTKD